MFLSNIWDVVYFCLRETRRPQSEQDVTAAHHTRRRPGNLFTGRFCVNMWACPVFSGHSTALTLSIIIYDFINVVHTNQTQKDPCWSPLPSLNLSNKPNHKKSHQYLTSNLSVSHNITGTLGKPSHCYLVINADCTSLVGRPPSRGLPSIHH